MAAVALLTEFLRAVGDEDMDEALRLSNEVLAVEPNNELMKQYQPVLKATKQMHDEDEENDSESTSGDEETKGGEQDEGKQDDDSGNEDSNDEENAKAITGQSIAEVQRAEWNPNHHKK